MSFRAVAFAFVALLCTSVLGAPATAAITGVCPDGSIFIVQDAASIPCREAKRVDPSDVPPIQPEYLPRPYGWERFHRRADPNNPYNLVDRRAPEAPVAETPAPPAPTPRARPSTATPAPGDTPGSRPPPQVAALVPTGARASNALALALGAEERANLDEIVGLLQSVAPASVSRLGASGQRRLTVQLARSPAFENRLHQALARRGISDPGAVVLFRAVANATETFHGNLTFVQGHVAFHPDPQKPEQFGLIDGAFGELAAGDRVLGYAVLPAHLDAAQPLDIYWNDLRISASLSRSPSR